MKVLRSIAVAIVVLVALSEPAPAAELPPLTVFAAASTYSALTEIAALYETEGGVKIRLVFASSGVLARQIANGAPADLFISANRHWMGWLIDRGLVDFGPPSVLGNRLVLIQPADSDTVLGLDDTLPGKLGGAKLAMGDPGHVPAGIYAKEALGSLGLWQSLQGSVVFLPNVRAALQLVGRGEAAAGIVYASDVVITDEVRIAAVFPPESHVPIVYPAGVVTGGQTPAAGDFRRYLQKPGIRAIFRRHGFDAP